MKIVRCFVLLYAIILLAQTAIAQQVQTKGEDDLENTLHHHVSLIISSSHLREENEVSGKKRTLYSPTIGVNYELWFNRKWALGAHNDIIVNSLKIRDKGTISELSNNPILLTTIVGLYKPWKHWTFFSGPGKEFEKTESGFVIKAGVEYGIEFPKNWELGFGFEYDTKADGYNSWLLGIGFSRNIFR